MRWLAVVCVGSASAYAQTAPPTVPAQTDTPAQDAQGGTTVTETAGSDETAGADAPAATATVTTTVQANPSIAASSDDGLVVPIPLEFGLDFGVATMRSNQPAQGYGPMFAMVFNTFIIPEVGFGVRGQVVYSPDPAVDGPMLDGHIDDEETTPLAAWSLTAGPRFRIWSDPAARLRWVIDLDGGVVYMNELTAGPYPLARITLGRQVAAFDPRGNGVNGGLALSIESGFGGAADYQAIFGSTWFHGEGGVDAAPDPGPHDGRFPSTFTIDVPILLGKNFGSASAELPVGVSVAFGVALSKLLEPRIRLDTLGIRHSDGDTTKMIGGSAGVRLRIDSKPGSFVDLYGGYERAWGIEPLPIGSGPFVDIGAGFHSLFCRYGGDIGVRFRLGIGDDNDKLKTLALVLGGARANVEGALGTPIRACGKPE